MFKRVSLALLSYLSNPTFLVLVVVSWAIQSPLFAQGGFNYFQETKLTFLTDKPIPHYWADSCQAFLDDRPVLWETFFYSYKDQKIIPVTVDENTPRTFINRFITLDMLPEFERLSAGNYKQWKSTLRTLHGRVKE